MPVTIMRIKRANFSQIQQEMQHRIMQAPLVFRNIMMLLDLSQCEEDITQDFLEQIALFLKQQNIIFSGIQNPTRQQKSIASLANIPLFNLHENTSTHHDQLKKRSSTMILHTHIRSGQNIHAHSRDLIIFGSVSQGAEVMADGNIFIYGTLRGKALAGISGDQSACIFCKQLDAELISIAQQYILSQHMPLIKTKQIIHIKLHNNQLIFQEAG